MRKSGFYFTEGMPVGPGRAEAGTAEPEKWKPYKIWSGDRWECEGCNAVIVVGCGVCCIAEHYQEDFDRFMKMLNAGQFQVNDC